MSHPRLVGLLAAVLTPMDVKTQQINLSVIPAMAEYLLERGVGGFYCCGSTGEGVSLTSEERRQVAQAWVNASRGRVPVIVQVGHNSTREAAQLAQHAAACGATAVSATCPSYFKIDSIAGLVECMSEIAAGAPTLPFYYYHIPSLTGNRLSMTEFLSVAAQSIPNLAGMKYTATELYEFLDCIALDNGRFEIIWGVDEMLLGALAMGAKAAIGSTYNVATPLYRKLIDAFDRGDLATARELQLESIALINRLKSYPFLAALKQILTLRGFSLGNCRSPNGNLSPQQIDRLQAELVSLGFNI